MMKRYFLLPCLLVFAGCNATVNGPFLNHVKAEKRQAQDLEYVADQLIQFPDLKDPERANLRWQMRKVASEIAAVSKIAEIVREHVANPWWGDWFFPFDGWGETPFYVSDESVALNQLTRTDLADLKRMIDQTENAFGMHIPLPSHPKMTSKEKKAEKLAQLRAEKIAKAKAQGKIDDPFTEKEPPAPQKSVQAPPTPAPPQLQPEMQEFIGGK
ncbi:hypothetical protein FAI41_04095 [Acetobacteraceae bacterium]|nr:hypothetical protein FAI41_04095 [Acetobacteraceae bacterium]